jgi:hypothetical protein
MANIDKFPTSVNNIKCISKCYPKNVRIIHPNTLLEETNIYNPFCAIPRTNIKGVTQYIDQCELPKGTENIAHGDQIIFSDNKINMLYPIIDFKIRDFLSKYYNIKDVGDFYIFLKNNKSLPVFTKLRLIDCFIQVFGKNIIIAEDALSDTLIDIIKKFWIKKMYSKVCAYIGTKNNDGIFINPNKNTLKKSDDISIRTKFLISKLVTPKVIFEITNNYFSSIASKTEISDAEVEVGVDQLYDFLLSEMIEKIRAFI